VASDQAKIALSRFADALGHLLLSFACLEGKRHSAKAVHFVGASLSPLVETLNSDAFARPSDSHA
jgi:hypothetical protein